MLGPGDSIAFESTIPHRLHNDGDEVVAAIWVVLGRHHERSRPSGQGGCRGGVRGPDVQYSSTGSVA